MALSLPVLLLFALGGDAGPQVPPASGGQEPESYRISVNVDLVVLRATVCDRKGRLISDLREEDFEVYENSVRQFIRLFRREDTPVTVGLVVDHSGSMRQKLNDVITAARIFVQSSNAEDEMFVVNFNENVTLGLPAAIQFTNSSAELERAIGSALATGKTALYDAIAKALERLPAGRRDKKVLIVISDGDDTASAHSLAQAMKMAEQSNAIIYTVGLFDHADPDAHPGVLTRLAQATGGEAFFPEEHSAAVAICERIARDIRNQNTIGYVPTDATRDGSYRAIRVLARSTDRGKLLVRTRAGYIAGGVSKPVQDKGAR
ncbi:MAG: VWA domain-containing protein [Candidatus Solibacter usitatus]|nr:VWA domain-containing protein [Candidatus Solibacter usitatus]